jgi:hypothetical protein
MPARDRQELGRGGGVKMKHSLTGGSTCRKDLKRNVWIAQKAGGDEVLVFCCRNGLQKSKS